MCGCDMAAAATQVQQEQHTLLAVQQARHCVHDRNMLPHQTPCARSAHDFFQSCYHHCCGSCLLLRQKTSHQHQALLRHGSSSRDRANSAGDDWQLWVVCCATEDQAPWLFGRQHAHQHHHPLLPAACLLSALDFRLSMCWARRFAAAATTPSQGTTGMASAGLVAGTLGFTWCALK